MTLREALESAGFTIAEHSYAERCAAVQHGGRLLGHVLVAPRGTVTITWPLAKGWGIHQQSRHRTLALAIKALHAAAVKP